MFFMMWMSLLACVHPALANLPRGRVIDSPCRFQSKRKSSPRGWSPWGLEQSTLWRALAILLLGGLAEGHRFHDVPHDVVERQPLVMLVNSEYSSSETMFQKQTVFLSHQRIIYSFYYLFVLQAVAHHSASVGMCCSTKAARPMLATPRTISLTAQHIHSATTRIYIGQSQRLAYGATPQKLHRKSVWLMELRQRSGLVPADVYSITTKKLTVHTNKKLW